VRARQLGLEPRQMVGDQAVANVGIRGGEHGLDLGERHLDAAEPANHLRDRDLVL
jgi:hypothetical protein